MRRALQVRRQQPALHPDADLQLLSDGRADVVILRRCHQGKVLVAVHNITGSRLTLDRRGLEGCSEGDWSDCLSGRSAHLPPRIQLEPYAVHWLIQR